ncbi:MAG: hypothetical protein RLY86_1288, partial [Pseudomonadota bacterium]
MDQDQEAAARSFGQALAALPVVQAADRIGALYSDLLPAEHRSRHGVFYTPPALSDRLVDQAEATGVDWASARVLDPTAGGGALLLPVAMRMAEALQGAEPAIALQNIAARLRGWELDPFAAWIAQVMLELALLPLVEAAGRRLPRLVEVGDSLARAECAEWDLVIANPPYGRIGLAPPDRARFARSLYGHANLYGVFLDLAIRLTRPKGIVSFLVPSSFLGGEYFKNLRRTLAADAPPVRL